MGDVQTAKQTSGPTNPEVDKTITKLLQGVQSEYAAGPKVLNKSLYAGTGAATDNALSSILSGANNPDFINGVGGALDFYGKTAAGDYLDGNDPYFQRNLERTLSDTGADVNSQFGAMGRYGSNLHAETLAESLGGIRDRAYSTELDAARGRQAQATAMLPDIFGASLLPANAKLQAGQLQDADAQAGLMAENDLFRRKADANTDLLAKLSSILAGNAAAGGTEQSKSVPWWAAGLGIGSTLLGLGG